MADERDTTPSPAVISEQDETILRDLREAWDYDHANWDKIRREGDLDVRYCAGDTWDKDDLLVRQGRPTLKLDQLSQYLNQLENTVRQNKRAIKASPEGDGATDKLAELRANRIREIEYQSHAQEAYIQAFANCAMRSYGFCRIVAEYEDEESDRQVLRIKAIANPNQVLPDSDAESTSGRDWKRLFFVRTMTHREFRREYPTAQIRDFTTDMMQAAPQWVKADRVQVAEYWTVTETPGRRGRPTREVCQYVTNGVELLQTAGLPKKTVWPGRYVPFAACYGKILYRTTDIGDSEKLMLSYVRLGRDAAKEYNWIKSTEAEELSMSVKAAMSAYEGQVSPENLELLVRSIYSPVPLVQFKATIPEVPNQILPLPQRPQISLNTASFEAAAESARRDIQNALGRYSVTDQRLGSTKVTSGIALQELTKSGDLGSYHFIDHYDDMICFVGEQLNDLLPHYDDTATEIAVRLPDGSVKMQRVNTPTQRAPDGSPAFGPDDLRMDQGRFAITISTGPSFDSQREAGKETAMSLLGNPAAFPVVASDAIRLLDLGPIGDQMAEDLEYLQPPQQQQARMQQQEGEAPDPKALQAQLAQLQQKLQELEGVAQEQQQELQTRQGEQHVKLQIAQMENETKLKIAASEQETRLTIEAQKADAAQALALMQAQISRIGAELEHQHAAQQQMGAQAHQAAMAETGAGQQAEEAERARQFEADQATAQAQQAQLAAQGEPV